MKRSIEQQYDSTEEFLLRFAAKCNGAPSVNVFIKETVLKYVSIHPPKGVLAKMRYMLLSGEECNLLPKEYREALTAD